VINLITQTKEKYRIGRRFKKFGTVHFPNPTGDWNIRVEFSNNLIIFYSTTMVNYVAIW